MCCLIEDMILGDEIQLDAIAQSIVVIIQEVDTHQHMFVHSIYIFPKGQILTVPPCKQSYAAVSVPSKTDLIRCKSDCTVQVRKSDCTVQAHTSQGAGPKRASQ